VGPVRQCERRGQRPPGGDPRRRRRRGPGRYISLQQQFAEQKGAIAFLYGTLGFSPNGNNKYLDAKKIFTFGTEGGLDTAYNDPYVLTATPTGHTNADSILLALGDVARRCTR